MDENSLPPRSPRAALEPEPLATPKSRRSRRARHPIVIVGNAIFTIVLLLAVVLGALAYWGNQRFEEAGPLKDEKIVNIPRGLGVRDIAELLTREGVIREPWIFVAGAAAMKIRGADLKFGEYEFAKGASPRAVAETMVEGKVVQHQFTVAEGLTSEQIVARLLENDKLTGNIREIPREGSLLPDGYRFTRGTTRDDMIKRMQAAQARLLKEAWERRSPDVPVKTPEQLITLASIIEKETGKSDERTRVAAVFVNRLKSKMKLQSDPTIIYGLVGGKGSLGRGILKSEISQPTPYNTYVIEGLPPGPIANPGRASIEAAANPARTKELFFVADGTGGHAFSETYDQHQKHVAKLRGIERDARDAAADAAANAQQAPAAPAAAGQAPAQGARPQPASRPAGAAQPARTAPATPSAQPGAQPAQRNTAPRQGTTQPQPGAAQRSQTAPVPNAARTQ
ncbi:endolytic transglycosylase MltG [Pseudorhodoplanes sp.]|uniref:endolytic transglycosylase MltG n=1 Tax=Pseudorhodoplanes sp. TaxID=1934341 RepID=UPI002B610287|nr:endolytic transglycosylase MltG [Pseudorhodoplanes sp.]HWV52253.1 endolytic transglycosylase MltG [Pseudorhodoplanes sp.]